MPFQRPMMPIIRYKLDDYINNPSMVKLTNDAQLDYLEVLQKEYNLTDTKLSEQTNQNHSLKAQVRKIGRRSLFQSSFIIIGGILFGIGVSVATASPHDWPGWVLSVSGSMLQIFSIVVGLL